MKNKLLILILSLLMYCITTEAEPALPYPIKITQSDGTQLTVQLIGDEFFHYYRTIDGLIIKRNYVGIFEYVDILGNDSIVLSGVKANDVEKRNAKEIGYIAEIRNKAIESVMFDKKKRITSKTLCLTHA